MNGLWKLGNFECACRYETLTKKYLSSLKLIRAEECVTPEENEQLQTDLVKEEIYAIDIYGLGTLIATLLTMVEVDGNHRRVSLFEHLLCWIRYDENSLPGSADAVDR